MRVEPLYRHAGAALLRAAASRLDDGPDGWPDLADPPGCRAWLTREWSRPGVAAAVRQASASLADRLDVIQTGTPLPDKQVRRAALALVRYLLRATCRHTPFGLFAGVAAATVTDQAEVRWGGRHRVVARVDTQWLADVIDALEACPRLLERLEVVVTNLAVQRGARLETPDGPNRVSVRHTSAVAAVRDLARTPIRFAELAARLEARFPAAKPRTVAAMLTDLVGQRVLITCLRAPATETDPLGHLLNQLATVDADTVAAAAPVVEQLRVIHDQLGRHNDPEVDRAGQADIRARLTSGMRTISGAGRTPLAVDMRLDCEVRLPGRVARDVEAAATALARLTRQPTGEPAWRDWYTAFCDRYGTGTQVPLRDAIDPDAGLGYPAGYPGSVFPPPRGSGSERDEKLLALAWTALQDGSREINLDNDVIRSLAVGDPAAEPRIPPHVEVAARIHATSIEALNNGEYLLTVAPGRSFGTFTSRFTTLTTNSNLSEMYAAVPTSVAGALPVQLSFPPVFPHAENICRVPAYLPHVLSLGEHRRPHHGRPETDRVDADGVEDTATITLEDLAVIATRTGLHLVSVSRQRVVDPQVFHGLALDKQPPPLARFLIHLTRALGASWHVFDWGPAARLLPCLPRVRYGRAILAPARWRVTAAELPTNTTTERWAHSLAEWRALWRCPRIVELADADRTLRLDLDEPAHAAILHADLHRRGHAVLTETVAGPSDYGWIGGHAHEIVFPLTSTRPPEPSPLATARPVVTNRSHGQWPACPDTRWLNAKIHTHPQRLNEFVTEQLPRLLAAFAVEPDWWFIRYRGPHETDHLRLRLRTPDPATYGASLSVLGAWGRHLRDEGRAARLVIDTYSPEVGRYGTGPALVAAENLFVADSRAVAAQLRHLPSTGVHAVHRDALSAANMVAIVEGFLGDTGVAMRWLTGRPAPAGPAADRACRDQVINLLNRGVPNLSGQAAIVARTWQARAGALAAYRAALPAHTDLDAVVESLLHMHHNRLIGPDRDRENTCRRLARQAALTWLAQHDQHRDDQHRDDQ